MGDCREKRCNVLLHVDTSTIQTLLYLATTSVRASKRNRFPAPCCDWIAVVHRFILERLPWGEYSR
jgi:hypothetical protein